jgi:hypothetical protein
MSISRIKSLWMNAIIKNKLTDLLKLYTSDANFKGTLMVDPVQDKKKIKNYFKDFTPIVNDIKFLPNEVTNRESNIVSEIGSYKFYTNKGVIKAQYSFVFLLDKVKGDRIISHFSTLICIK